MKSFNLENVSADSLAHGKWAELNREYFANPKIINELFSFFKKEKVSFEEPANIIDLGSAEGLVGEHFANKIGIRKAVSLTILDIVKEHLDANKNSSTEKICKDLLHFEEMGRYNLAIMNSVLHYFSKEDQLKVLKNIRRSLNKSGVFLLKAFIQYPENMELFHKLNRLVGKNLQLISAAELEEILEKTKFTESHFLGNATTWNCTSNNLRKRYDLSEKTISKMITLIKESPKNKKKGFTTKGNTFSIPIPYKVYLLKK